VTWSAPIRIADARAVGTHDPQNVLRALRDGANLGSFASGPNGLLVAVWQDSRFSGGARDGIAFSRSTDGGNTWSAPLQVNAVPGTQALLPAVSVRPDGVIGVLYYDMRNDTADPATLFVDTWLATSSDGVTWSERHVAGPLDLNTAPVAESGLFIGDYQGLASTSGEFAAFFARTNADLVNRTDIFGAVLRATTTQAKSAYRAAAAPPLAMTADLQERLQQSIHRTLRSRLVGGAARSRGE
jgi:hypothetical protein